MAMFDDRNLLKYSKIVLIFGAINTGLVKFLTYDLIPMLSFGYVWAEWLIYGLITAAGLYAVYRWRRFLN